MTRQESIEVIVDACSKANGPKFMLTVDAPSVNLADVLLAFQSLDREESIAVLQDGQFAIRIGEEMRVLPGGCWNLKSNILEEQSGETLDLIARLLRPL